MSVSENWHRLVILLFSMHCASWRRLRKRAKRKHRCRTDARNQDSLSSLEFLFILTARPVTDVSSSFDVAVSRNHVVICYELLPNFFGVYLKILFSMIISPRSPSYSIWTKTKRWHVGSIWCYNLLQQLLTLILTNSEDELMTLPEIRKDSMWISVLTIVLSRCSAFGKDRQRDRVHSTTHQETHQQTHQQTHEGLHVWTDVLLASVRTILLSRCQLSSSRSHRQKNPEPKKKRSTSNLAPTFFWISICTR